MASSLRLNFYWHCENIECSSFRMNDIADKITLKRNQDNHEMLMSQVCTRNLKRIFQVSTRVTQLYAYICVPDGRQYSILSLTGYSIAI